MNSTIRIKEKALSLGFDKVGVARALPLEKEADRLKEWLGRGYHATMGWMKANEERRVDPDLVVPGARSVISLALNYRTDHEHFIEPGTGKISRYAWGDDYHDLIGKKLGEFWGWLLEEYPGIQGRSYVDTGPVMDKVWAERAGLGWIGKHTNLITRDLGSWVFLAEIITTLDLEADTPETDHCGTCTLCIEACPTDAIVEPYVVDSNRCISYLTIEHRGDFVSATPLDGWIYGCDVCQDVCPWNEKFALNSADPAFHPREWNRRPILSEWASMSADDFSEKFRGSPVKRTRREGLLRNVRTVIRQQEGVNDPYGCSDSSNPTESEAPVRR